MTNPGRLSITILFCLLLLAGLLLCPAPGQAGEYADSAHGNSGYGVLRTVLSGIYLQGNCGHCHEQHTANADGFLLLANGFSGQTLNPYDQDDNVCFQCHTGLSSLQSGGSILNNNYSAVFGGETPATATSILAAFNQLSYHNLNNLRTYISGLSGFTSDSNPCSGCHNIHKAKANWRAPGDPGDTAISRPSDHDSLWGDGAGETMQQYATSNGATYRAPFYVGAVITSDPAKHEPDGSVRSIYSNEVQGSITPDYNSFCLSCHQYAVGSKNAINFGVSGDKHGLATAGSAGMQGQRMAPYTTDGTSGTSYDSSTNFALSCLDCHEPHGSNNIYLLRSTVNGTNVNSVVNPIGTGTQTVYFCRGCHTSAPHNSNGQNCLNCHSHGVTSRF